MIKVSTQALYPKRNKQIVHTFTTKNGERISYIPGAWMAVNVPMGMSLCEVMEKINKRING